MRTFTGVLAVLDRPSTDGRVLQAPATPWSDAEDPDLRWPLVAPAGGAHIVGIIMRLWIDGPLLRYSGVLDDETYPALAAAIDAGEVVGHLDATIYDIDERGEHALIRAWQVVGATLLPASDKAWPEVVLDLGHIPNPMPVGTAGGFGIFGDPVRVHSPDTPFGLGGATVHLVEQPDGSIRIEP